MSISFYSLFYSLLTLWVAFNRNSPHIFLLFPFFIWTDISTLRVTSAKIFPKYIIFCCLVYFSFFLRPSGSGHMDVYGIFFSDGRIVIIVLEEVHLFPRFCCLCVCLQSIIKESAKSRRKSNKKNEKETERCKSILSVFKRSWKKNDMKHEEKGVRFSQPRNQHIFVGNSTSGGFA